MTTLSLSSDLLDQLDVPFAWILDDGRLAYCNASFEGALKVPSLVRDEFVLRTIIDLARNARVVGLSRGSQLSADVEKWPAKIELRLPEWGWIALTKLPLADGGMLLRLDRDVRGQRIAAATQILVKSLREGGNLNGAAAEALSKGLGYRWARITRFLGNGRVRVVGAWNDGAPGAVSEFDLSGTPCEEVVRTGEFRFFPERVAELFPTDEPLVRLGAQVYVGNIYFGPDGRPLGHVYAVDDQPDSFDPTAQDVIALVTGVVSREIQLQSAIDATRKADEALFYLHQEMEVASKLQQSILPRQLDFGARNAPFAVEAIMRPAREIGGDFYDFFFTDDATKAILLVADVCGKGVPAALFAAISRTCFRASVLAGPSIEVALGRVNAQLGDENPECMFVTAFLAELELATGRLCYINAGHCDGYVVRAAGGLDVLPATGAAIALMSGPIFESHTVTLNPGDFLLLVSDGVTEAFSVTGELFGAARLVELLGGAAGYQPGQALALVDRAILDFAVGCDQSDDITCLALAHL